jgi:hypothetical protein
MKAAMPAARPFSSRYLSKYGYGTGASRVTSRPASEIPGAGRNTNAFRTENNTLHRPMPRASVATVTSVKPGFVRIPRTA